MAVIHTDVLIQPWIRYNTDWVVNLLLSLLACLAGSQRLTLISPRFSTNKRLKGLLTCTDSCFTLPVFEGMCYLMLFAFLCLNRLQDLSDTKDDTIPLLHYCAASTLQSKHRGAVTDIKWLPPAFVVRPRAGWQGWPLTLWSWELPFKCCTILQDRNGLKLRDQTWMLLFTCLRMFR